MPSNPSPGQQRLRRVQRRVVLRRLRPASGSRLCGPAAPGAVDRGGVLHAVRNLAPAPAPGARAVDGRDGRADRRAGAIAGRQPLRAVALRAGGPARRRVPGRGLLLTTDMMQPLAWTGLT